jgi:hypothetical protein
MAGIWIRTGSAALCATRLAGPGTPLFPTSRGRREGMEMLVTGGDGLGEATPEEGLGGGGIEAWAL